MCVCHYMRMHVILAMVMYVHMHIHNTLYVRLHTGAIKYACIMHLHPCVLALAPATLASCAMRGRHELAARPRAKQGPDWSEGPSRAPGRPLMELSPRGVLAVRRPPLLSHIYIYISLTRHACCLPDPDDSAVSSQPETVPEGVQRCSGQEKGCDAKKSRGTLKDEHSCLRFPPRVQCSGK